MFFKRYKLTCCANFYIWGFLIFYLSDFYKRVFPSKLYKKQVYYMNEKEILTPLKFHFKLNI